MSIRILRAFPFVVVILLLLAAACSEGEQTGVGTLQDIPGGFEGPTVRDSGPHSARIVFTAGTPVVCNVAYGPDLDYGRLSLMAMTGPLTDHDVLLVGLEPSTTYHFKVTVTDLASNVYQSGDLTFDTGEPQPATGPSRRPKCGGSVRRSQRSRREQQLGGRRPRQLVWREQRYRR